MDIATFSLILFFLLMVSIFIIGPLYIFYKIVQYFAIQNKRRCDICSQQFRGRAKKYLCRVEGQKRVLCSRCARKLEDKVSSMRFREFFESESNEGTNIQRKGTSHKRKGIPNAVKREVWRRDNAECVECSSNESLEYDHIIPVSKGGANTVRNIQLLCEKCNRTKSNKI